MNKSAKNAEIIKENEELKYEIKKLKSNDNFNNNN